MAATLGPTLPADVRIVTSPSRRARETAAAIAETVSAAPVVFDDRWLEVDFGLADGRTFDELAAVDPDLAARLGRGETAIDWPDGERAVAFADRVAAAWRDLVETGVPTVLVSHAGPLRVALAIAGDRSPDAVPLLEPAGFVRLELPGRRLAR